MKGGPPRADDQRKVANKEKVMLAPSHVLGKAAGYESRKDSFHDGYAAQVGANKERYIKAAGLLGQEVQGGIQGEWGRP